MEIYAERATRNFSFLPSSTSPSVRVGNGDFIIPNSR